MTELTLQRLKAAGWTPGWKVDITPIEEAYAEEGMQIPDKLREFFEKFGLLGIEYDRGPNCGMENHHLDPRVDFLNYEKEDYENFFGVWGYSRRGVSCGLRLPRKHEDLLPRERQLLSVHGGRPAVLLRQYGGQPL